MSQLVTEIVKGVLETLGSPLVREIDWIFGVKDELTSLQKTLYTINSVLLDVQEKQQFSNNLMKCWMKDVKDVACDIEDVLDLIATQDLKLKVHGRGLRRRISRLFIHYDVAQELKSIRRRLDQIAEDRRTFHCEVERWFAPPMVPETVTRQRETYSFIREGLIVGREVDKERLVNAVLSSFSLGAKDYPVVLPIIGLGGIGKTALAKLVYNDDRVAEKFGLRLWACVSNKYVLKTLMEDIIQAATGNTNFLNRNMESLQRELRGILGGQTYLLVLDDVWIEDSKEWLELKELLAVGSSNSTIVVTTREEKSAFVTGTTQVYKLKGLSDDHCCSIFFKCAFKEGEEHRYPQLVEIGKSIACKCLGVPLAAKTLGSLLCTDRILENWRRIEQSELWQIEQRPNDILPALSVSFDHTPNHLRSCFSTCAIYPKDAYIEREEVEFLWMALGISPSNWECGVNEYYNELVMRSFFEVVRLRDDMVKWSTSAAMAHWDHRLLEADVTCWQRVRDDIVLSGLEKFYGKINSFQMHDLMHDLATYVVGEEMSVVTCNSFDSISPRARHVVWDEEDLSDAKFPTGLSIANRVRTFSFRYRMGSVSKDFLDGIFSICRCLRVLFLSHSDFDELPESVGSLMHLRCLKLTSNHRLRHLPGSVCQLVNLQTLDVLQCHQLESLPTDMDKLVSLRHLLFTSKMKIFPERGQSGWSSLNFLSISYCKYLACIPEEIGNLTNLQRLQIISCPSIVSLPNSINCLTSLLSLRIRSCKRLDLTGWQGLNGLRSLQFLSIFELPRLVEFPGGFHGMAGSLQHLIIKRCELFRGLPECLRYCTSLLKLMIFLCPKVSSLPRGIVHLKNLHDLWIMDCPLLTQRCERGTGEYWDMISHIYMIQLDHRQIQKRGLPTD